MFVAPELGDRVQDPITGFTGIVICISFWLHGCTRVGVQPEGLDADGKPIEEHHFDQSQVVVTEQNVHTPMVLSLAPAQLVDVGRSAMATPTTASGRQQANYHPILQTDPAVADDAAPQAQDTAATS